MPLLDTWGFFRPRHPFWVDTPALSAPPLAEQGSRKHSLRSEAAPPQRLAQQLLGSADSTALGVWTPRPRVRTRAVPLCLRKLTSAAQRELSELKGPGDLAPGRRRAPYPAWREGEMRQCAGSCGTSKGGRQRVRSPSSRAPARPTPTCSLSCAHSPRGLSRAFESRGSGACL